MPRNVLLLLTSARDWRFLLLPEYTEACTGIRSWCPCSALNYVLGSLADATIFGKQVFVHFNKGWSLIYSIHILIKIQILPLSGTPNVWDIWEKAMLCYSTHTHLSVVLTMIHAISFVSLHTVPQLDHPTTYFYLPSLYLSLHIVLLPVLQ